MHALHLANDALRFLLELAALAAVGFWAWSRFDDPARWGLALLLPVVLATLWAVFRVPGDPGPAPVAIAGSLRLTLEAAFFGIAILALSDAVTHRWGLSFALLLAVHYALDWQRVLWLFRR
jgi:hypothetical protein